MDTMQVNIPITNRETDVMYFIGDKIFLYIAAELLSLDLARSPTVFYRSFYFILYTSAN